MNTKLKKVYKSIVSMFNSGTDRIPSQSSTHNPYGYGNYSTNQRGSGAKYSGGLARSGRSFAIDHHEMRLNARNAYHDTLQARAIVDRYADVVVDSGIKIAPTPDAELLGISIDAAEQWADRIGRRFDLYMSSKKCHAAENMTGYQAQRLYEIFQQRDNDIFIRFYYRDEKTLLSSLQFDFVDPCQLRNDAYTTTNGFNDSGYDDGIKRDDFGKEISYQIWINQSKETHGYNYKSVEIPAEGKSGRKHMLHGFSSEYAGQGRGYSKIGHALQELENLTDFTLATIKKAINQANITMFVEPGDEEDAENPFEGITQFNPSNQFGSNPTPAANAVNVTNESLNSVEFCPIPEADLRSPGSTGVFNLQKGSKLKPFENSAPGDTFDKFVDSFTAYLAASANIPIEIVLMRFSSNYSASRGALILFWRVAWIWRNEMDADFLTPLYEAWISEEIAAGREQAIGWSDPNLRAAWLSHDLIASPIPNIDDVKSAKANKLNLEMNATDFDRVARDTNGSNGKANRSKLGRQVKQVVEMPFGSKKDA